MDSLSFDQAANIYDATRSEPPGITEQAAAELARRLPPGSRLLELGVGTGRFTIPLLHCGLNICGLDISRKMMEQFYIKERPSLSRPALVEANLLYMPFGSAGFDVVVAVHVLHLINAWQDAVSEIRRALAPGGALAIGFDWRPDDCPSVQMREEWENELRRLGYEPHRRMGSYTSLKDALLAGGALLDEWTAAGWIQTYTLSGEIERLQKRTWSVTWEVPEEIFQASIAHLRSWAAHIHGSLDSPRTLKRAFIWQLYRWE